MKIWKCYFIEMLGECKSERPQKAGKEPGKRYELFHSTMVLADWALIPGHPQSTDSYIS